MGALLQGRVVMGKKCCASARGHSQGRLGSGKRNCSFHFKIVIMIIIIIINNNKVIITDWSHAGLAAPTLELVGPPSSFGALQTQTWPY